MHNFVTGIACLLGIAFVTGAAAADPPPQAPKSASCAQKVAAMDLTPLAGSPATLHGEGFAERAAWFQRQLRDAQAHLDARLDLRLEATLVIIGEQDWLRGCMRLPYGIPHVIYDGNFVFMAGDADNPASRAYAETGPLLPAALRARIERPDRSFEDAARRFIDLIVFHELGHLYAIAYGVHPSGGSWLGEFVASYLGSDFLAAHGPDDLAMIQAMNHAFVTTTEPRHTSLEDFNRLYLRMQPENYGWYQGRIGERVGEIHARRGIGFIHALNTADLAGETDHARLLERLDAIEPGFSEWAQEMRAPRPAPGASGVQEE